MNLNSLSNIDLYADVHVESGTENFQGFHVR